MNKNRSNIVICNNAPFKKIRNSSSLLELEYREGTRNKNLEIHLNSFVNNVYHLNDRIKDLLEIAGFIFGADRKTSRGKDNSVEFNSWSRRFEFHIKVRDFTFWSQNEIKDCLSELLCFMTGDASYNFVFSKTNEDIPASLFDNENISLDIKKENSIILFSGGLDSLAGVVERLATTKDDICLVSHQSGQPSIIRTQDRLVKALKVVYPGRIQHYKFRCSLSKQHAVDESQRTRSFLFGAIAFAIASAYDKNMIFFYENGITSLNLPKTQDMMNARASRTTHPKTLKLLEKLLSLIADKDFYVHHPYFHKTKTDIVKIFVQYGKQDIIDSSVSCSKTFLESKQYTHCGKCSQCIDRRFSVYAANLYEYDHDGLYEYNFLLEDIDDPILRRNLNEYIRFANEIDKMSIEKFYNKYANELVETIPYIKGNDDCDKLESIYSLCTSHSKNINVSIKEMTLRHNNPFDAHNPNSFFNSIIANREYQKENSELVSSRIIEDLKEALPIAFHTDKPKNENQLNDYVESYLNNKRVDYDREFGLGSFALAKTIVDHKYDKSNILIECKYIRENTPPSVASEGIAADLTKYPKEKYKLFLVYDPNGRIKEPKKFCFDFENGNYCKVGIIR